MKAFKAYLRILCKVDVSIAIQTRPRNMQIGKLRTHALNHFYGRKHLYAIHFLPDI